MTYDIWLIDPGSLSKICSWRSTEMARHLSGIDDVNDLFDVSIDVHGYHFSEFTHTLKSVVMDLMINHRLLMKEVDFNFFISDRPVFKAAHEDTDVVLSFFNHCNERVVLREPLREIDTELSIQTCHGLQLIQSLTGASVDRILREVHEDIQSDNRSDFFKA